MKTDLFINNEWRPAASGKRFPVENPATEENLADVAQGDAADVDNAVRAAKTCFESQAWRDMSGRKRGKLLFKAADLLEARLDEVARLETAQNGKTLFESKIEIGMTINTLRYYAGWADKIVGDTLPVEGPFLTYTLREPIGVVGAIVPWNFPLNIASWKFAPALAAGCTVVLKPASETPLTALLFAEIALEAGLPPGAFNVVPGGGSTAGAALVRHPDVDKISFTGSTEVGRQVMKMAAETNKRVTMELGGKSPNIIFADADLKAAVRGAQTGIFYGKGEVCAAGSRLLVEKSVHAQVIEQLAEGAKKMTPGDPLDKNTRLGALVSRKQQGVRRRAARHDDRARRDLWAGARRADLRRLRAGCEAREQHHLRSRRRAVDKGHPESAPRRQGDSRRHGVDQLVQLLRLRRAVWRVQSIGIWPRPRA